MKFNRVKTYLLLLLVMVLVFGTVLSIGQSYARYTNTAVLNTVLPAEGFPMTSNCLVSEGKQIILLGELPQEGRTITFTLETLRDISDALTWSSSQGEYINVELTVSEGEAALDKTNNLAMEQGTAVTVSMTITPTEQALTTPRDAVEANVAVTYGSLQGTFRVKLPAVEAEEEPTEPTEALPEESDDTQTVTGQEEDPAPTEVAEQDTPTEPEESTVPETTAPEDENTVPETTAPETAEAAVSVISEGAAETTEATEDQSGTDEPSDPEETTESTGEATDPTAESSEPTEETTQPSEDNSDPTEAPTGATEETSEPTEETSEATGDTSEPTGETTEPTDGPTEPDETVPDEGTAPTDPDEEVKVPEIETIESFNTGNVLPLVLKPSGTADRILLGLEQGGKMAQFPAFTRYKLDNVNYLLYDAGYLEIPVTSENQVNVLLDMSVMTLEADKELTLMVQEYLEDEAAGAYTFKVTAKANHADMTQPQFLTRTVSAEAVVSEDPTSFTIDLPMDWVSISDLKLEYDVEMMCADESGIVYEKVALDKGILAAEYIRDAKKEKHTLTISFEDELPTAGTYRLNLRWIYQGVSFEEIQIPFFIQYPASTENT